VQGTTGKLSIGLLPSRRWWTLHPINILMVFRALQESLLYILYHNREMADSHGAILLHVFIFLKANIASKKKELHTSSMYLLIAFR
jgi:hypothetical protein